jgi:hypothetical protein
MADGGYNRIVELDENGKILGALGEPGHAPGQFAWAHFLTFDPDRRLFVVDVLNWRAQVFAPTNEQPGTATYIPTVHKFWNRKPSNGSESHNKNAPLPEEK